MLATVTQLPAQDAQSEAASSAEKQLQKQLNEVCDKQIRDLGGRFRVDGSRVIAVAGLRKLGDTEAAEVTDAVHLGSCTKAMAAAIIGQLCTENKLTLDATLETVLPDVKELQGKPVGQITIRQLLQHRSGLPANVGYDRFDAKAPKSAREARRLMLLDLAQNRLPNSGKYLYSNTGYTVLGHIAESIENETWEDLAKRRLFDKLGMKTASFGPVGIPDGTEGDALPGRAWGHIAPNPLAALGAALSGQKQVALKPVQIDNSRCMSPAGRAHMNLDDWSRFVIAWCQPEGNAALGISKAVLDDMLRMPNTDNLQERYSSGWIAYDNPAFHGKGLFHNGSNTSWYCYALASPDREQCVLVAINSFTETARRVADEIARELMGQQ